VSPTSTMARMPDIAKCTIRSQYSFSKLRLRTPMVLGCMTRILSLIHSLSLSLIHSNAASLTARWQSCVNNETEKERAERQMCKMTGTQANVLLWDGHRSATCVQRFDDSLIPAIHTTYRISLRSSSSREPRYPLLGVVFSFLLFFFYFIIVLTFSD